MPKLTAVGKQKKREALSSDQSPKKRVSKASRSSASYRETTRELLKTFPELPTGPSNRRRSNPDELLMPRPQPSDSGVAPSEEARETGSDAPAREMEQDDDNPCGEGDGDGNDGNDNGDDDYYEDVIFSGNSCGGSVDEGMAGRLRKRPGNPTDLPVRIWWRILGLLHPVKLAQLRTCCRFFDDLLRQDVIWRESRTLYLPELPKPVLGLSELEMFQLLFGSRCMLCEAQKDVKTYWPFRTKCCKRCVSENTTKVSNDFGWPRVRR